MTGEIFNALLLVFNFLGIAAIGFFFMMRLLRSRENEKFAVVVPMHGNTVPTERLYARHLSLLLSGEGRRGVVVAVDYGLPEAEREACMAFCRTTQGMYYTTPQDLPALLSTLQKD